MNTINIQCNTLASNDKIEGAQHRPRCFRDTEQAVDITDFHHFAPQNHPWRLPKAMI
jgi:hypothetical protein